MNLRNRGRNQARSVRITRNYIEHAEGSALIELGKTKVLCVATAEKRVPSFLEDCSQGWVTAEYSMLPRSTSNRTVRDSVKQRQSGRVMEIQRFIGRSLRAAVDLHAINGYTITLDCDVIQADGGTRTASVTGACVALFDIFNKMIVDKKIISNPMKDMVAAISVGIIGGQVYCDLDYSEDVIADTDMNIVMLGDCRLVEIQGTAERTPFSQENLLELLALAGASIEYLIRAQRSALGLNT